MFLWNKKPYGESDGDSGPIKLHLLLSVFATRSVIQERNVALGQLSKITCIPKLVKELELDGICKYRGKANWTLVWKFFAGINPFQVDQANRVMVFKVQEKNVRVTYEIRHLILGYFIILCVC